MGGFEEYCALEIRGEAFSIKNDLDTFLGLNHEFVSDYAAHGGSCARFHSLYCELESSAEQKD